MGLGVRLLPSISEEHSSDSFNARALTVHYLSGGFMKRIAIVATLALLAACAKGDKTNATDTSTAGGAVAPAATDSTSGMSNGSTMSDSLRKSDSIHMATGSSSTTSSDSSKMNGSAKTSPTSDQPVTAKGDTLKKPPTP
jgi:hypothetical protein